MKMTTTNEEVVIIGNVMKEAAARWPDADVTS